ncbi:MAG: protein translocase subunit SecF [Clostridia bacterium]|nr:protein translocase subunit SecF [Clostridia bacterium]
MINFYKNKKWFFCISALLMIIGVVFIFINGVQLDIQFTGGTKITYSYKGDMDIDAAQKAIQAVVKDRVVNTQSSTSSADGSNSLVISLSGKESLSTEEMAAIDDVMNKNYGKTNEPQQATTTNVEPYIGARFLRNGILAVALAIVLIIIFITIRFKIMSGFSAALCALIALFHDVLIVFFVFVVMGIPLNDGFIAVVLTILGYSVNDTLVIFDRIRENKKMAGDKVTLTDTVNLSINQCFRRCIVTSVLTFSSMLLVFIFALINDIPSVVNFALPLMIGILSGCYSSVCLASPLWTAWQNHKNKK